MSAKDYVEKDYYKVLGVPKDATTAQKLGTALYANADAAGAAAGEAPHDAKPEDDVVDAEIVDDEKPKGGHA